MQRRANQAVDRADLVIRCTPGGDRRIDLPEHCTVVDVVTKADLCKDSSGALATSALERTGIDELLEEIVHALGGRSNTLSEGVLALSRRHEETLRRVLASIEMADDLLAQDGVEMIPPAELIASTLRSALDGLGELVGRVTPDEVLEHVFARFCVGK